MFLKPSKCEKCGNVKQLVQVAAGFVWKCLLCVAIIYGGADWPQRLSIDSSLAGQNNIVQSVASTSSPYSSVGTFNIRGSSSS